MPLAACSSAAVAGAVAAAIGVAVAATLAAAATIAIAHLAAAVAAVACAAAAAMAAATRAAGALAATPRWLAERTRARRRWRSLLRARRTRLEEAAAVRAGSLGAAWQAGRGRARGQPPQAKALTLEVERVGCRARAQFLCLDRSNMCTTGWLTLSNPHPLRRRLEVRPLDLAILA